jgi:hypothetical protein
LNLVILISLLNPTNMVSTSTAPVLPWAQGVEREQQQEEHSDQEEAEASVSLEAVGLKLGDKIEVSHWDKTQTAPFIQHTTPPPPAVHSATDTAENDKNVGGLLLIMHRRIWERVGYVGPDNRVHLTSIISVG